MGRPRKRLRENVEEIQNTADTRNTPLNSREADQDAFLQGSILGEPDALSVDLSGFEQSQDDFMWTLPDDIGSFLQDSYAVLDNPEDLDQGPVTIFKEPLFEIPDVMPNFIDKCTKLPTSSPAPPNTNYYNASSDTKCECLANLNQTLASFRTLPPPSFPQSLGILTKATTLGRSVLRCQECRKTYVTAVQNLMLLCTLLTLIGNEYARLLSYVSQRTRTAHGKIIMRMGEHTPGTDHLHTNTPDCPMGFSIAMTSEEWGTMVRKAIKTEVLGTEEQLDESLVGLIDEMEKRQRLWHTVPAQDDQDRCQQCESHTQTGGADGDSMCLSLVNSLRRLIQGLDL